MHFYVIIYYPISLDFIFKYLKTRYLVSYIFIWTIIKAKVCHYFLQVAFYSNYLILDFSSVFIWRFNIMLTTIACGCSIILFFQCMVKAQRVCGLASHTHDRNITQNLLSPDFLTLASYLFCLFVRPWYYCV